VRREGVSAGIQGSWQSGPLRGEEGEMSKSNGKARPSKRPHQQEPGRRAAHDTEPHWRERAKRLEQQLVAESDRPITSQAAN